MSTTSIKKKKKKAAKLNSECGIVLSLHHFCPDSFEVQQVSHTSTCKRVTVDRRMFPVVLVYAEY